MDSHSLTKKKNPKRRLRRQDKNILKTLEEIEDTIFQGANDYQVLSPGPNNEVRLMPYQTEEDDQVNPHKFR